MTSTSSQIYVRYADTLIGGETQPRPDSPRAPGWILLRLNSPHFLAMSHFNAVATYLCRVASQTPLDSAFAYPSPG